MPLVPVAMRRSTASAPRIPVGMPELSPEHNVGIDSRDHQHELGVELIGGGAHDEPPGGGVDPRDRRLR